MRRRRSLFFWLLMMPWRLACFIVSLVGRLGGLVVGALMVIFGLVLSFTIIGSIIGIPLMIEGALVLWCALTGRRRRPRRPGRPRWLS